MKPFVFFIVFFSLSSQALNVLDILERENNDLALQKELKKDVGSLFSTLNKPGLFIRAFEKKDFHQALRIWKKLIAKTNFAKSSTGQALYSYLLFQNQFEVLSLTNLLEKSQPEEVDPIVVRLWKKNIGKQHPVWDFFSFRMDSRWLGFFDSEIVFKTGAKSFWDSSSKKDQEYIKFLLGLPLSDEIDPFSLEWSFILSLIQQNDLPAATKILAWLISETKDQRRRDKIHLNIGRLLADIHEKEAALSYYKKVERLSYFWLLAQEEMSWILFNKGDYREAYSTASSFLHPELQAEISPYMLLILSLSQLQNCDYKGFYLSLSHFKSFFSKRADKINQILSSGGYDSLIDRLVDFYNSKELYYNLALFNLPYVFRKDVPLRNSILLFRYMQNQKKGREKNPSLEQKEKRLLTQLEKKIKSRVSGLLKKEREDIFFVLQNFHIAEAELLYRSQGFHSLQPFSSQVVWANRLSPAQLFYDQNDFFIFPFNPNEVWLDELSYYQSGLVRKCPGGSYVL